MEFSFGNEKRPVGPNRTSSRRAPPSNPLGRESSSSPSSDRLQKAIERNRAKQAKRTLRGSSKDTINITTEKEAPQWEMSAPSRSNKRMAGTRKSVARPDDFDFSTPVKTRTKSSPSVGYKTKKSTSVKTRVTSKKQKGIEELLIKGVWVFYFILSLRLIFSDGGVIDYYSKKSLLDASQREFMASNVENTALLKEIDLIKKNGRYQRKLVRDHLGFIAPNEYLILFAEDSASSSI